MRTWLLLTLFQGIVSADLYAELERLREHYFSAEQRLLQSGISWWTRSMSLARNGELMLIDEIHTPVSSRYFYVMDIRLAKLENHKSN